MIPKRDEMIPKREEMISKRDVFHCSGTGSLITAEWLHFYPSFLRDSFILTSGLTLTKGHPREWRCSVAAISSLMQLLEQHPT